ncbi:hypothetical protein [Nocardioides sp. W7]|uniref:hypothetical protein n=1 Tax=Nocardioides sp. W7 TaxID=2931390 RepID=UPI001FD421A3|nr:hypothetical protein [Nocardioides sp. W7]
MPDELSEARRDRRAPIAQALAILALFTALGAVAGWVWFRVWDAPPGVVSDHTWYPDPYMPGRQAEFDAIALYVLVALAAGVLGGVVCALVLDHTEVVTVVALAVGSCLAAWVMARVGMSLGPTDPEVLAKTAADGTRLPGHLVVDGLSPYVALPVGALAAVLVVLLATLGRRLR